ncbi:MAG: MFS transporter [Candidatus Hydrogenedentota bacterium]|nr:MAG: MFS transporter [Candidatus Hydrogenedentota bacterium]
MNKHERWIVFLLGSAHTMVHFYEQIFPALLLTMVAYFQIELATAGWMQTLLAMAFGLGALPAGYIADRVGTKRIVMVYLVGAALSCIFISTARSATALAAGLAAMGAFISLYHPAGTTLVTTQVRQVGKALGYHGMGGGLGVAIAPALATLLAVISPTYGWRLSFASFGVLGLVVATGMGTLKISSIQSKSSRGRFWPEHLAEGSAKPLILFLFVAVMIGFCYRGVMTYLPTYFSQRMDGSLFAGHALLKGGTFTTITLLVGVVGQFVGGHLTSRYNLERLYAFLLIVTVPLLLMMGVLSNFSLFFATTVFAFFHFSGQPVGNSLIAEYTDPRGRGLGYGLYFATVFGLGSLSAGFSGMIADRFGLNEVFLVLAIVVFFGFLMMLYLARGKAPREGSEFDAETGKML